MDAREKALEWWNSMNLERQLLTTIEHNSVIEGDCTRHPHTLTGLEIEKIHNSHIRDLINSQRG